jgi:hypothetical protein
LVFTDPAEDALIEALGSPRVPRAITQVPFDHDPAHYARLCALAPGELPRDLDLVDYCLDLTYQPVVQPDLFRFLLPVCLRAWRASLAAGGARGAFAENLYPALIRGKVLERLLDAPERAAVAAFMRGAVLALLDGQRGLQFRGSQRGPHHWVRTLNTYGVILPDLPALWDGWWALESVGGVVASLQYLSCLMYAETDNPVFAPWTPKHGGGPPVLWEYDGLLYEDRWLPGNVAFPEATLDVARVEARLRRGSERLQGEPEHAMACRLAEDFASRREVVASRCAELPGLLSIPSAPESTREWSR